MSGSALSVGSLVKEPLKAAKDVARHLNCTEDHRLLSCLREKPLKLLLSAPVLTSQILPTFGPSEDGVIIVADQLQFSHWSRHDHKHTRRGLTKISLLQGVDNLTLRHGKKANYDLLLGVVNAEAFSYFSEEDILYGIETWKKIQVLQTFINSTYRHHQSQILATLVNEYTEWERPIQHPINTLCETVEALGDGLVVAPILRTADMHAGNSFLYVFSHHIRSGLYPQKPGCIHGEELPYVFGVPLMNASSQTLSSYNFSRADTRLSRSVMTYWANFARTGNPNRSGDHSPHHHLQKTQKPLAERWLPYDKIHKRYLLFDSKPRLRNHYRAHRLSFWLNLVPQLLTDVDDDQFAADSS
ncbi:neurexin protein binding [Homalodisca vitripennis]|nr:neurexin protein binding [Homalodisca vitripennis]